MTTFAKSAAVRLAPQADPNVIPFIDVLLVLLVIFMVTAPQPTTDLRVDLPSRASGAPAIIEPTIVQLRASPEGHRLFVGAVETTIASVAELALAHIVAANPALAPEDALANARVYVRADMDVAYQSVVSVVDALKARHFVRVSIIAPAADAS